jgi:ferric-dicitrate binding protein FerR (iron transport regulator)
MSDEQKTAGEEPIATLLKIAGPRPRIADDVRARVRASVHEEWQRNVNRGRARLVGWSAAAIAATAAIVFVVQRDRVDVPPSPQPSASIVASVRKVEGSVSAGNSLILDEGTSIRAGARIRTSEGALAAFDWSGGSLRVAAGTEVTVDSATALTLARGAVYFASGPASRSVEVRTPFGVIRDVGTQFEVQLGDQNVRVRVREGRVNLERDDQRHTADAGTELAASPSGSVERRAISTIGSEWDWVLRAAPTMALDGSVQDVLSEIAREKGLSLRLSDPAIGSMTVHGNVPLGPDEALDAAVAATGLRYRVSGQDLIVEKNR